MTFSNKFNICAFDSEYEKFSEQAVNYSESIIEEWNRRIDQIYSRGGT